jgi:signal transduction histidine kinase
LFNGNELKAARELKNIECEIKDRSGQTHNLLVNVKRVRIKGGTTLYACRDITDRKRAESLVKQLSRKTIAAIESQRKALSREIHDSIGGTLAAIKYQLESRVEQMGAPPESVSMPLENIVSHLDGVIHESRRITKQLRPSVLDDFGLRSAMDEHIRDFQSFHPKITVLRRFDIHEDQLTSDAKIVLYRVLQETLNNVGKHSKADQVHIQCYHGQGSVILQVEDNGVGFDLEEVFGSANVLGGYGLYGMTERVEICSGQLHVASKPGQGTTVHARIPLEAG